MCVTTVEEHCLCFVWFCLLHIFCLSIISLCDIITSLDLWIWNALVLTEQHNYMISRGNRQKSWIQKLLKLRKNCSQQFFSTFIKIADVNLEKEVKLK